MLHHAVNFHRQSGASGTSHEECHHEVVHRQSESHHRSGGDSGREKRQYDFYKYSEINEDVNITHKLDFSNFIDIDLSVLKQWEYQWNGQGHALDTLYRIVSQGGILHG